MARVAARLGAAALIVAFLTAATVASPSSATISTSPVRRVLIISLPATRWADLDLTVMPNMRALLDESAVASLSLRTVTRRSSLSDSYLTISAGTRSGGRSDAGQCLKPNEPIEDGSAMEAFGRRNGVRPSGNPVALCLNGPRLIDANKANEFGAEVGSLSTALGRAGIAHAVIANGDDALPASKDVPDYERAAALSLMETDGTLREGDVSQDLLRRDTRAPFGVALNSVRYLHAFHRAWNHERAVVLVEDSDLLRMAAYGSLFSRTHRHFAQLDALRRLDDLVGSMLTSVTSHDAVMVLSPTGSGSQLGVVALRSPNMARRLLRSSTTRRSGVVAIVDVAPTILDQLGLPAPSSMEGRRFEAGATFGSIESVRERFVNDNRAAAFRDSIIGSVTTWYVVLVIVLMAAAMAATRWRRPLGTRTVEAFAFTMLLFPIATYSAALAPVYDWGSGAYWLFVLGVSGALGAVVWYVARRRPNLAIIGALGFVVAFFVVDVVTGAHLQYNTVFGYSPTVAGRFAGLGNPAYSQFSACGLLFAGLIAHRLGGRRGVYIALGVLALLIVIDGAPMWGSDVGGILSMVPAFGTVGLLWMGWKLRPRVVIIAVVATVGAFALFGTIDLSRPPAERTHFGRLLESTGSGGWNSFWLVISRKIQENLATFSSGWSIILPIVVVAFGLLLLAAPIEARAIVERSSTIRQALIGLAVLIVFGFLFNDSGLAVPGFMLAAVIPVFVVVVLRAAIESEVVMP